MKQVVFSLLFYPLIWGLQLLASGEMHPDRPQPPDRSFYLAGKKVFQQLCAPCHGARGKGDGDLVNQDWEVPPRDLSTGVFKYRSTPYGKLPLDLDLKRTIRQGIAGSAMPTFQDMDEKDLKAVVEFVKYLSPIWRDPGAYAVSIPLPPAPLFIGARAALAESDLEVGKERFQQLCAPCHGAQGKGDGPAAAGWAESQERPIIPANLMLPLGCGDRDEDILRTVLTGMSGTPMPSFAGTLSPGEAWQIVQWIQHQRQASP